ncbi:SO_0444 family Cu/Zn efflux transporter [Alteromonas sp. ASW11-19]|uniref:SO_0444 family Cu/Zn efflux transporter n=1 Tax=Alteromonas salexigens TaxID=2982530 RepID=A0ABT2VMN7_9ALTE|nr:SO_0444 family Cu/Zn efflux transporter [Alteromonas salexigens]MCU7554562.1 SO_0444 family Cu/Zn efflux transporter [Alteromonas salexigens]
MADLALLLNNFLALFIESAPWLLLGLFVAGVMHEWVPVSVLQKHMGSASFSAIGKAAVIGAPLPLCSCGVIPAAVGLRRSGASKPATVSFLVSTPETGVDSVSVSYALLGPVFAVVRPVVAVLSAVYAGVLVRLFGGAERSAKQPQPPGCCEGSQPRVSPGAADTCCDSAGQAQAEQQRDCCAPRPPASESDAACCGSAEDGRGRGIQRKLADVFNYATGNLLDDIIVWLLVGLALAAAIKTWVPADFLTQWGDGFLAMLVMALVGIPMYICATASTPLAVGFLAAGLSPGAILVFLMAGPATNISTMGMIYQEMGRRTLALYLFAVVSMSMVSGYALNWLADALQWQQYIIGSAAGHLHSATWQTVYALSAVMLMALMMRNVWQRIARRTPANQQDCCS